MKSGMKTIQSQCQRHDCYYLEALGDGHIYYCNYIGHTGHRRGCTAAECDRYRKKNGRKPKNQIYIGKGV